MKIQKIALNNQQKQNNNSKNIHFERYLRVQNPHPNAVDLDRLAQRFDRFIRTYSPSKQIVDVIEAKYKTFRQGQNEIVGKIQSPTSISMVKIFSKVRDELKLYEQYKTNQASYEHLKNLDVNSLENTSVIFKTHPALDRLKALSEAFKKTEKDIKNGMGNLTLEKRSPNLFSQKKKIDSAKAELARWDKKIPVDEAKEGKKNLLHVIGLYNKGLISGEVMAKIETIQDYNKSLIENVSKRLSVFRQNRKVIKETVKKSEGISNISDKEVLDAYLYLSKRIDNVISHNAKKLKANIASNAALTLSEEDKLAVKQILKVQNIVLAPLKDINIRKSITKWDAAEHSFQQIFGIDSYTASRGLEHFD